MKYLKSLDGLRGIAILVVCFYHWKIPGFVGGYFGVDIFFVLSGYLITSILLDEYGKTGGISFSSFYYRRFLRLLPALLFLVIVHAGLAVFSTHPARHYIAIVVTLLYLSNWSMALGIFDPGELGHTWSLSVEEQFYLLWPITMYTIVRKFGVKTLAVCTFLLALASTLERTFLYLTGSTAARVYYALDTRLDSILYGSLVGVVLYFRPTWSRPRFWGKFLPVIAIAGLAWLITTCKETEPWRYWYGFLLAAVFSTILVWTIATPGAEPLKKALSNPVLVWFGKRSYGLYLWHDFINMVLHTEKRGAGVTAIAAMLALGITELSFRFIERPALSLRTRLVKQVDPPAVEAKTAASLPLSSTVQGS